jgi:hypothetical protein
MADPASPPQIDDKVLRSMTNLIVNAVQVHRLSLEEACGRAWGYCHAYHPWLPAEAIEAAIRHCRTRLRPPVPRRLAPNVSGVELREVDDWDLQMTISEALSDDETGEPLGRAIRETITALAAAHLVERLRRCGYVAMVPDRQDAATPGESRR